MQTKLQTTWLKEELRYKLELEEKSPKTFEGSTYEIWQLKDTPENEKLRFADFAYASNFRLTESRYDKVYDAKAGNDDSCLEDIFTKFNLYHPSDFKGHSLSLSDVVVVDKDGKKTAWYCDSFGFKPVAGFSQPVRESRGRAR